ncbi:3-keto-disaccharide hydrolase [Puia sp. P3]|uniref:3-keto-disaccharide hydrolase n=1 Tax=Puia sp. P3 TaxID=3423952 RepID=UPI003D6724B2
MKQLSLTITGLALATSLLAQTASWNSLFDGKTLNGWKRLAGTAEYKVEDGAIVGTTVAGSGNTFLVTEKEYDNFILEMDIRADDTSSNSGVQTRSHYNPAGHEGKGLVYGRQFEIDPSSRRWSGGIYDEGRRDWLYPASLNPSAQNAFKRGQYNHIRIECIGNSMKTWLNGTAVASLIDTIDTKGFIGLQVHAIHKDGQAGARVFLRISASGPQDSGPPPFPRGRTSSITFLIP